MADVEWHGTGAFCERCGRDLEGAATEAFVCGECRSAPPHFAVARSAVHYHGTAGTAIKTFKYQGALWACDDLTHILEACWRHHAELQSCEALCPLPLHAVKMRQRYYNQSEILAKALAKRLALPCFPDMLRRIRLTRAQAGLPASERKKNVTGVFQVTPRIAPWVRGRRLLIIDDVMTTGATASEAAHVLMKAGAERVCVLTIARG